MLTVPALSELATVAGRAEATFGTYATQAIYESTLLFGLVTGLTEWPTDTDDLALAKMGVLKMADLNYLENSYRERNASGIQSETTADYSYTKAAKAAQDGQATGVFWWDKAVERLSIRQADVPSRVSHDGYSVFEHDNVHHRTITVPGQHRRRHHHG